MTPLLAVVVKEVRLLLRDPGGLLLLFLLPAIFIVALSVALQGAFSSDRAEDRLDMVVVDLSGGVVADGIARGVARTGLFRVVSGEAAAGIEADQARAGVADGRWDVAVIVPEAADRALRSEDEATVEVVLDAVVSAEVARAAEAAVRDSTLASMAEHLRDRLGEARAAAEQAAEGAREARDAADRAREGAEACRRALEARGAALRGPPRAAPAPAGRGPADAGPGDAGPGEAQDGGPGGAAGDGELSLVVEQSYLGGADRTFRPSSVQQNVPGWTIFALFWIAQILAVNILAERERGISARIRAAPVSTPVYLAGKLLPFVAINMVQAVAMFAVGVLVLPLLGAPRLAITNVPALALVTLAISLVSVAFGLLMASVAKSTFFVASATAAILIIMTVVGGIMVPKYVMPEVMQRLSLTVPHGWALEAYQEILVRGGSTLDVLPHTGVLLAFAAALAAAALLRMRLGRP